MKSLVYLVGPPGVGKSTVMAALTEKCGRAPMRHGQVKYDALYRDPAGVVGVELGCRREMFSGTDALGMAVNPHAVDWITSTDERMVLGEGARLANARFLRAAVSAGFAVHLVHLSADPGTLGERRSARGSSQSPTWVRGAETRARNIMKTMESDALRYRISANYQTPNVIAGLLVEAIPALGALR